MLNHWESVSVSHEYYFSLRSRPWRSRKLHVHSGEVPGCSPSHAGKAHDPHGRTVQQSWWVRPGGAAMKTWSDFCLCLFYVNYQKIIKVWPELFWANKHSAEWLETILFIGRSLNFHSPVWIIYNKISGKQPATYLRNSKIWVDIKRAEISINTIDLILIIITFIAFFVYFAMLPIFRLK